MRGVVASSTVLKYLQKVKLTNTLQRIQVYKSQENQMSKNSRKLWKAYIHFPYDLMKASHFWEVAKFQYQFIRVSTLSTQGAPNSDTVPLGFQIKLCTIFQEWRHTILPRIRAQIFNKDKRKQAGLLWSDQCPLPLTHTIIYAFAFRNLAKFRTSTANEVFNFWNDTKIKKKSTCALVCKKAAAMFSNLD